jgi:hypothetical protein
MTNRMPAQCFPLIDFIDEEMTARGWDAQDLIDHAEEDLSTQDIFVLQMVDALRPANYDKKTELIWNDRHYALLGHIFGISPETLRNIDHSYQQWKKRGDS